ncbi:MAG: TAXI family TRAP transporter solute-binding subunit [Deltaproteobacteria bacterium]|nr:TAXI family TRAP transporter solute-binding subunit [Deltaproteobacteria bacterium]
MKRIAVVVGLAVIATLGIPQVGTVGAETLPKILNMGTMPAGTLVNIQGTGIADTISKFSPMSVKIKAVTSEEVWVPMTLTGEVDLGVAVSLTMRNAYLGIQVYKPIAEKVGVKDFPLRLLTAGTPVRISLLVQGESPLNKISDLKGKTLAWFADKTAFDLYTRALAANGGLTEQDVKKFPVANPADATRAVMDANADACMVAVDAPVVAEAVAKVKARWLPVDGSAEAVNRLQQVISTAYVETCPGGRFVGVPKDQPFMYLDVYLVGHSKLPDAVAYEVTKTLWAHDDDLVTRAMLKEWVTDRFVSKHASVPYHPGAIKFYKEKGVWTQEMEDLQTKLLAQR